MGTDALRQADLEALKADLKALITAGDVDLQEFSDGLLEVAADFWVQLPASVLESWVGLAAGDCPAWPGEDAPG